MCTLLGELAHSRLNWDTYGTQGQNSIGRR